MKCPECGAKLNNYETFWDCPECGFFKKKQNMQNLRNRTKDLSSSF